MKSFLFCRKNLRIFLFSIAILCIFSSPKKEIETYKKLGEYQKAFLKLVDMNRKYPSPFLLYELGDMAERLQNYSMAMVYFHEILKNYPGSDLEKRAKHKLENYMLLYSDPDVYSYNLDVEIHLIRGLEALEEKDFHQAILHFKQGVELRDNHFLMFFHMGYAYYELYKLDKNNSDYKKSAIDSYIQAIRIIPSPKAYNNLACIFAESADEVMAHMFFTKAMKEATSPTRIPGLEEVIKNNLTYFAAKKETKNLTILRELTEQKEKTP